MLTSNTCPIDGSAAATADALKEADSFAARAGLEGKNGLRLRLLSEELLGVVNGLTEVLAGSFLIEKEEDSYCIRLSADTFPFGEEAERRLMSTSSTGENVFYKGVTGKLRMVADWFSKGRDQAGMMGPINDYYMESGLADLSGAGAVNYDPEWSLSRVRERIRREENAKRWDELEWSVLTCLADDVRVGLRFGKVAISVYKTF